MPAMNTSTALLLCVLLKLRKIDPTLSMAKTWVDHTTEANLPVVVSTVLLACAGKPVCYVSIASVGVTASAVKKFPFLIQVHHLGLSAETKGDVVLTLKCPFAECLDLNSATNYWENNLSTLQDLVGAYSS